MWIIVLLLIATIALKIALMNLKKAKKIQNKNKAKHKTTDYSNSYQKKYLLTKNEYYEYKQLKTILDKYEMIICPKVRLLDIIEPLQGDNFKGALAKVQSKHVDFVICDKNLFIKGIIELDDNSHNAPDRIERDRFVDEILTNVGYKIIHVRSITEETIKELLPSPELVIREQ